MSLANDLLDLAKIERQAGAQVRAGRRQRIIRECVSLMQPQAAQERIIMRLSLSERLPPVMADERSLRQIVLNLMSNAVKFNEPGGQVIVSTALDEAGAAVIRVRDTGVGMNENEIAARWSRSARSATRQRAGGAGLGLPLTKALAEANHADFSIKSRKEQGTLVEVAFPGAKAAQQRRPAGPKRRDCEKSIKPPLAHKRYRWTPAAGEPGGVASMKVFVAVARPTTEMSASSCATWRW